MIKAAPINRAIEISVTVEVNNNGAQKWRTVKLNTLVECYRGGRSQFVHNFFVPGQPAKPFFDVDFPNVITSEERETHIRHVINMYSAHCGVGSGTTAEAMEDWRILVTDRPNPTKTSYHLIFAGGRHYASNEHQLAHMRECGMDLASLNIDENVYRAGHSLRMIGSEKRSDPEDNRAPLTWIGAPSAPGGITLPEFLSCVPTYIPDGSVLIEVEQVPRRVQQRVGEDAGKFTEQIEKCVDVIRLMGNDDAEAIAFDYHLIANKVKFKIRNAHHCGHSVHEVDQIVCVLNPKTDTMTLHCMEDDNCPDRTVGLTQQSRVFRRQAEMLDFLHQHGMDRPDFILAEHGKYDTSVEETFAKIRSECSDAQCSFCRGDRPIPSFYSDFLPLEKSAKNLIDPIFFKWIQDYRDGYELCVYYFNLFVVYNSELGIYMIREKDGLQSANQSILSSSTSPLLAQFKYTEYTVVAKNTPKERTKETVKHFFPYWVGHAARNGVVGFHMGRFKMSRAAKLNLFNSKAVDRNVALDKFESVSPIDRESLEWIWDRYLDGFVVDEPEAGGHRLKVRNFLERYVLEKCFEVGELSAVAVLLFSEEGGVGKSTLPNLIEKIIGTKNCQTPSSLGEWLKKTMGGMDVNKSMIFADEIHFTKGMAELLKSRVTRPNVNVEIKYGKAGLAVGNQVNILGSSNSRYIAGINSNGRERRFFAVDMRTIAFMEETVNYRYTCSCEPVVTADGLVLHCDHECDSHADLMAMIYRILQNPDDLEVFAGYLFSRYLRLKESWTGSLQSTLPTTKCVARMQAKNATPVKKWMSACVERGWTWSPMNWPDKANGPPIYVLSSEMHRLGLNMAHKWETLVPVATLFDQFRSDCISMGLARWNLSVEDFLEEIRSISFDWRSVPLETELSLCQRMKCAQLNPQAPMLWEAMPGQPVNLMCVQMGDIWNLPSVKPTLAERTLLRQSSQIGLNSSSFGARSESLSQSQSSLDPYDEPEQDTRGAASMYRGAPNLFNIIRAVRDEDAANDGFRNAAKRIREEDIEEEEEENFMEKRPKVGGKFIARVEEDDDIEDFSLEFSSE